jgi:desulfoferrodoxin-like iron-binding protein
MTEVPAIAPPIFTDDLETADDFTKKHTPWLEVTPSEGSVRITVKLGHYVAHPNEPGHFFDRIELFCNDAPVAFFSGIPQTVAAQFSAILNVSEPGTEITAIAHCNLHGSWGAKTSI